ncbi:MULTISPECIES: SSI family serine proteinase inhibitor [unclassified Streptomyces]|uniref:SSI family serine proteinase inhibitor n=1 Tax=unclassified Streptomyces TaxID=2593676 RepID=UPI00325316C2
MLRRLALTAVVSLAVLPAVAPAATADSGTLPLPLPRPLPLPVLQGEAPARLTITVSGAGGAADGTFELRCAPAGGSHPVAEQACGRLDELAGEGTDPFAPVPEDTLCTQQYGGPAAARVTGTWQGRPVDTVFNRADGCEISRWNNLRPVLPNLR